MRVTGSTKPSKPFLLGVAGGSGSGKTFFARALRERLGPHACEIIYQDNFYFDQSKRFDFDGGSVNFDHPDAIDFARLALSLRTLKSGQATEIPIYDFKTHSRSPSTLRVEPLRVIVTDGILIFHSSEVRALFDELVFFDTPEELRFMRRLERDVAERGRTPEGVKNQFYKQVKPMHDQFVAPSKEFAHHVVMDIGGCDQALESYCERLRGGA
ncbi:MAG: uridine kinase [Bacteriovoracia bacterium]